MIKNIVFDLGNVLIDYNPKAYLTNTYHNAEIENKLSEYIFGSQEWVELDRGTITQEDAIKSITQKLPSFSKEIKQTFDDLFSILLPLKDTVAFLTTLKEKGLKLYYLSNYHKLSFEHITSEYEFFKLFDGGVVSYKEKLLKPEKEIYQTLLERYDLSPQETVFVDDMMPNIEGARALNIHGIQFKSIELLEDEFKKLGVL